MKKGHTQVLNFSLILGFSLLFALPSLARNSLPRNALTEVNIRAAIYHEHLNTVKSYVVDQDCSKVQDYTLSNQILIEAILLCQALKKGGITPKFDLISVPNQSRALAQLNEGSIDLSLFTLWNHDKKNNAVLVSSATINRGEFVKAIYTSSQNDELTSIDSINDLTGLTAAANETWKLDIQAIHCLGLNYQHVNSFPQMMRMVNARRLDYLIHNISSDEDMHLRVFDTDLKIIPGLLIALPGSLHYFLSNKSHNKELLANTLEKGLKELRSSGTLKKAYQSVSFFDDRTKDWNVIQCSPQKMN